MKGATILALTAALVCIATSETAARTSVRAPETATVTPFETSTTTPLGTSTTTPSDTSTDTTFDIWTTTAFRTSTTTPSDTSTDTSTDSWTTSRTATSTATSMDTTASDTTSAPCPIGWENFGDDTTEGTCLRFVTSKVTWQGMRLICRAMGGDLAKLEDPLHHRVAQFIKTQLGGDLTTEPFWIGGSDEEVEGSWKWTVDDTDIPLGTPHWYPCNDDSQPSGGTTQNHLSLYPPGYYFHSLESSLEIYGICQMF